MAMSAFDLGKNIVLNTPELDNKASRTSPILLQRNMLSKEKKD
jgi:hypothetical protein